MKKRKKGTIRVAVLASGNGSNFEALVSAQQKGKLGTAAVELLITDKKRAFVRKRARRLGIKEIFIEPALYKDRGAFDKEIIRVLCRERIGLVVLAGYMRILSALFVKRFRNRIINIHPSLLPSFKGTDAIRRARTYGVKVTGVTVHFIDERVDHGPIILQEAVCLRPHETLSALKARIHRVEHSLYPQAVALFSEGKLVWRGRNVFIKK